MSSIPAVAPTLRAGSARSPVRRKPLVEQCWDTTDEIVGTPISGPPFRDPPDSLNGNDATTQQTVLDGAAEACGAFGQHVVHSAPPNAPQEWQTHHKLQRAKGAGAPPGSASASRARRRGAGGARRRRRGEKDVESFLRNFDADKAFSEQMMMFTQRRVAGSTATPWGSENWDPGPEHDAGAPRVWVGSALVRARRRVTHISTWKRRSALAR